MATVRSVVSELKVNQQRRFHVFARTHDGTDSVLVKNLPEDQARYIAWVLRSAINGR